MDEWTSPNGVWRIHRPDGWRIENLKSGFGDSPIVYEDGRVAFDHPEVVPEYVKNKFRGMVKGMKEMMRPTLKQIFHSEQVVQKECCNITSYRHEIEYTIGVLKGHLGRVQGWQSGREHFNSEFVLLMQVVDAAKERAGDSKMVVDSGNTVVKEPMRPTLKRIYNAEQIGRGTCCDVMGYRREIECTIGVLKGHLVRIKGWLRGDNRENFNSEFVLLMQELEAK